MNSPSPSSAMLNFPQFVPDDTTMPKYMNVLFNMIEKMSEKIDNLENKLDVLMAQSQNTGIRERRNINLVPDFIPDIGFHEWISNFDIGKQDIIDLFSVNILDGFKTCIAKHMNFGENRKPICIYGNGRTKQIYIYDLVDHLSNDSEWRIFTDNDVCVLIEIIWRKMATYYFIDEEEELENIGLSQDEHTQRDMNKKVLLDMKPKLMKHIKDIMRFISQLLES